MGQIIVDDRGRAITADNRFPVDIGENIVIDTVTVPAEVTLAAGTTVQLSGSSVDLRGLLADRPAAAVGNRGVTWWATDRVGQEDEFTISTGSAWVNLPRTSGGCVTAVWDKNNPLRGTSAGDYQKRDNSPMTMFLPHVRGAGSDGAGPPAGNTLDQSITVRHTYDVPLRIYARPRTVNSGSLDWAWISNTHAVDLPKGQAYVFVPEITWGIASRTFELGFLRAPVDQVEISLNPIGTPTEGEVNVRTARRLL